MLAEPFSGARIERCLELVSDTELGCPVFEVVEVERWTLDLDDGNDVASLALRARSSRPLELGKDRVFRGGDVCDPRSRW